MQTVKELCVEYGLSMAQLAKRFGIPYRTVQDWFGGKRTPPDYVVKMMAEILLHKQPAKGLFMKNSYPIILTPGEKGYIVFIPDFNINTQGDDITEAIEMARDAIGLMGVDMEDDGEPLPAASSVKNFTPAAGDIISLVDVDFAEYRRKNGL